jgi:hypothetical protein
MVSYRQVSQLKPYMQRSSPHTCYIHCPSQSFLLYHSNDNNALLHCAIVSLESLLASLQGLNNLQARGVNRSCKNLFQYETQNIFWKHRHLMLFFLCNSCKEQQVCSCKDTLPCNLPTINLSLGTKKWHCTLIHEPMQNRSDSRDVHSIYALRNRQQVNLRLLLYWRVEV